MRVRTIFAWYDLRVGAYWDRERRQLYLLPLPCIGVVIDFGARSGEGALMEQLRHWAGKVRWAALKWADDNSAPVPDEWWQAAQVYDDAAAEITRLNRKIEDLRRDYSLASRPWVGGGYIARDDRHHRT